MKRKLLLLSVLAGTLYIASCGKRNIETAYPRKVVVVDTAHPCTSTDSCAPCHVSYKNVIAPLIDTVLNCNSCHSAAYAGGSGGGIVLDNYTDFSKNANQVYNSITASTTDSKFMPKYGTDPNPPCQVSKIKAWIDQGMVNN